MKCIKDLKKPYYSKYWANKQLRYAISVLKARVIVSDRKGLFTIALSIKERLNDNGFWWQSRVLGYHINKFLVGGFTPERARAREGDPERERGGIH